MKTIISKGDLIRANVKEVILKIRDAVKEANDLGLQGRKVVQISISEDSNTATFTLEFTTEEIESGS